MSHLCPKCKVKWESFTLKLRMPSLRKNSDYPNSMNISHGLELQDCHGSKKWGERGLTKRYRCVMHAVRYAQKNESKVTGFGQKSH